MGILVLALLVAVTARSARATRKFASLAMAPKGDFLATVESEREAAARHHHSAQHE